MNSDRKQVTLEILSEAKHAIVPYVTSMDSRVDEWWLVCSRSGIRSISAVWLIRLIIPHLVTMQDESDITEQISCHLLGVMFKTGILPAAAASGAAFPTLAASGGSFITSQHCFLEAAFHVKHSSMAGPHVAAPFRAHNQICILAVLHHIGLNFYLQNNLSFISSYRRHSAPPSGGGEKTKERPRPAFLRTHFHPPRISRLLTPLSPMLVLCGSTYSKSKTVAAERFFSSCLWYHLNIHLVQQPPTPFSTEF